MCDTAERNMLDVNSDWIDSSYPFYIPADKLQGMRSSDSYLEKALAEFNDKVNALESAGDERSLVDAYINRGCVLAMMDSIFSAIDDFQEAIDLMKKLSASGTVFDPGYTVKAYVSRGELQSEETRKDMLDDYRVAASKLAEIGESCKFYERKDLVEMCIDCAGDLVDNDFCEDARPFLNKGLALVVGREDAYSRNRYVEINNLAGQSYLDGESSETALKYFREAARVGRSLYESKELESEMDLVLAYVYKGDVEDALGYVEDLLADREEAIDLLETLKYENRLDDEELLSNLHGETAQIYMKQGRIKDAERHLMKQVAYNLSGSTEYLNENAEQ